MEMKSLKARANRLFSYLIKGIKAPCITISGIITITVGSTFFSSDYRAFGIILTIVGVYAVYATIDHAVSEAKYLGMVEIIKSGGCDITITHVHKHEEQPQESQPQ